MANIGSIVGGAFNIIKERPGAVVAWALTYIFGMIALFLLVGLLFAGAAAASGGGPPEFSGGMILGILLFYLGYFLLLIILMNAVFRTVLRPDERSLASLRLGMDEFRMLGLQIIVLIASMVLAFILQLVLGLVVGIVMAATRDSPQIGFAFSMVLTLAYVAAWIWLSVRISLLYPMTFYRRSIVIDEAWSLGRGSFWALFISYVIVVAPVVVLFIVTFASMFAAAAGAASDPYAAAEAMDRWQASWLDMSWGAAIALGLVWIVVLVLTAVLWPGVMASAAKELLIARGDYSEEDVERTAEIFE